MTGYLGATLWLPFRRRVSTRRQCNSWSAPSERTSRGQGQGGPAPDDGHALRRGPGKQQSHSRPSQLLDSPEARPSPGLRHAGRCPRRRSAAACARFGQPRPLIYPCDGNRGSLPQSMPTACSGLNSTEFWRQRRLFDGFVVWRLTFNGHSGAGIAPPRSFHTRGEGPQPPSSGASWGILMGSRPASARLISPSLATMVFFSSMSCFRSAVRDS